MTWFMAGAAAVGVATSLYSQHAAASSAASQAGAASRAEGEAVVKERLNKTIANSYATAFAQMQLGLKKKQLAQQGADITAAGLAVQGNAAAVNSAAGGIGASTEAVVADINGKVQQAQQQTQDAFENAVENYNTNLSMMVLNTDQSSPNIRQVEYTGPSGGEMLGGALLSGLAQFAGNYAMRSMNLGAGTGAPQVGAQTNSSLYALPTTGVRFGH